MRLPIEIYVVMADVVKQAGFKKLDWARASSMPLARITELNRLAKLTKQTQFISDPVKLQQVVGRAVTLEKAFQLIGGIRKIMGNEGVERLLSRLPELENKDHQNYLMLICLPDDKKVIAHDFLQTLLQAVYPGVILRK